MVVDRYTKAVLTVIAVALIYIGLMLGGRSLSAQGMAPAGSVLSAGRPQPVVIVGWGSVRSDGQVFVSMVRGQNGVVSSDPALPTKIQQTPQEPVVVSLGVTPQRPLPVGITSVDAGSRWDALRTRTDPQAPTTTPGMPRQQ